GGGGVAVHGAEVTLAVFQRQAHGEVLSHADHGVINGGVSVRVVFTHHFPDDFGGFLVFAVPVIADGALAKEDAAVHRLEAVADIWQGARDDDGHGVVEVRLLHFVFDGDGLDVGGNDGVAHEVLPA